MFVATTAGAQPAEATAEPQAGAPPPSAPPTSAPPPSAPAEPAAAAPSPDGELTAAPGGLVRGTGSAPRYGAPVGLDLNLEGALGGIPEYERFTGFGRVRIGVLVVVERVNMPQASPLFISTGLTYEISDFSPATLGLQTELIHITSGFWGQMGALVDVTDPSPGVMASLGWSVLGFEVQRRFHDIDEHDRVNDPLNAFALYGKLRVPVSVMLRAF